jgi:5-methylcytosine-specific restriction endonuclease McrA
MEIKKCLVCGKEFKARSKISKYCSFDCKIIVTKRRYRPKPDKANWFSIKEFINERDNYCCQKCNSDGKLNVHHIKLLCDGGTNDPKNLITLCLKCHAKEHKVI